MHRTHSHRQNLWELAAREGALTVGAIDQEAFLVFLPAALPAFSLVLPWVLPLFHPDCV
jgi:hypothetical protein